MRLASLSMALVVCFAKVIGQDFVAELIGPSRWSPNNTGIVAVADFTLLEDTLYVSCEPELLLFDFCNGFSCPEGCAVQYFTSVPGHLINSLRAGRWGVRFTGIDDPQHEYRGQITPRWLDSDQDGIPDY
jgi:hypothetical protein